jgi:subtilisin family serine protease
VLVAAALPATATTSDPSDGQWYIGPYQIKDFHAQGIDGSGVTIAVVDDAINLDVPQLQGANIEVHEPSLCYGPGGEELPATSDDPMTANHGTNVTSYIVGNGTGYDGQPGITGIAPKAKILFYSIRTGQVCESASGATDSLFVVDEYLSTAIIDATDSGADIINFSVVFDSVDIREAIAYALRNGVIVVGGLNNQDSADIFENLPGYPAVSNGVVSVASFGPDGDVMLNFDGEPSISSVTDVVAPGVQMLIQGSSANWTDTSIGQGNSFATPIVTGNLALAIQKYPDATSNQVIQSLIHNTGTEPHELVYDSSNHYGYGTVNTIMLLSTDPTQYEDVNPLLNPSIESGMRQGPSVEEVYGAPTASPSPSASDEPSPPASDAPGEDTDTGSPEWLLLALVGGGLALILIVIAIIIVTIKSSNNKSTRPTT